VVVVVVVGARPSPLLGAPASGRDGRQD